MKGEGKGVEVKQNLYIFSPQGRNSLDKDPALA